VLAKHATHIYMTGPKLTMIDSTHFTYFFLSNTPFLLPLGETKFRASLVIGSESATVLDVISKADDFSASRIFEDFPEVKHGIYNQQTILFHQCWTVRSSPELILAIACAHRATDPRDVVYGLLNLLQPGHGIVPDYRHPVRYVYIDWAVRAMSEAGSFKLLGYIADLRTLALLRSNGNWEDQLDLPSWVPDLSNAYGGRAPSMVLNAINTSSKTTVHAHTKGDHPFSVEVTNSGALKVYTRCWTTIKTIFLLNKKEDDDIKKVKDLLAFCFDYLKDADRRVSPIGIPPLRVLMALMQRGHQETELEPEARPHVSAGAFVKFIVDLSGLGEYLGDILNSYKHIHVDLSGLGKSVEDMLNSYKRRVEEIVPKLGLSLGDDFPDSYRKVLFPNVDIQNVMGWSSIGDLLNDTRVRRECSVFMLRMLQRLRSPMRL